MKQANIKGMVLLGVTLSVVLTSCGITKSYKTPQVDAEELFRGETATDTTTIAALPWREYFKDAPLQTLIDECLANNFDLKMAVQRVKQAGANLSMAKAAYYPTVALVGQVEHTRYTPGERVLRGHTNAYTLGLATTWEADVWGKLNRQSKAKYAQYIMSQESQRMVHANLVAGVATSYYTLLSLDEQLRISIEAVGLLKEMVATMEYLLDAGMQNAAAVEQMKATLYSTEVSIPDIENAIWQLENTICVLLGRKPGHIERSGFAEQTVPNELKAGLPVQMLANRPDVRSAELDFRAAFQLTAAAQAGFYPSITLSSGTIGYGASTLSQFFKPENIFLNLVGGLTQPLFAKKQLMANLKIQKATQEIALLTFEKTVLEASQEVSDILYTYESSKKKDVKRISQIESLKKSVEYTQLLLMAGEANYIEVITAEQNLLQAQLGQVSDKLEQLQAGVNLYKALGGGVE